VATLSGQLTLSGERSRHLLTRAWQKPTGAQLKILPNRRLN